MAILKLKPSGKDYIWGGHKLVDNYGKEMTGDRLAETWELSCHRSKLCCQWRRCWQDIKTVY